MATCRPQVLREFFRKASNSCDVDKGRHTVKAFRVP
jgi:hypothetical protein